MIRNIPYLMRRVVLRLGFALLVLAALLWSLVGTFVKVALTMVDSMTITFSRFFFGVVFLGILLLAKDRKIVLKASLPWIWIGAGAKCLQYIFENIGLQFGLSYSNMIVVPMQTVFLLVMTVFYFKERVTRANWAAAGLCMIGVAVISWNGLPIDVMLRESGMTTLLFAAAGVGAGLHIVSQKVLIRSMDAGNMNFTVFFWSSLIVLAPSPFTFEMKGPFESGPMLALIALGLVTGVSFYFLTIAMKKVSMFTVALVTNSTPLFSILWGRLFFGDPVTVYIMAGTAVFLAGIVLLNLPVKAKAES